VSGWAEWLALRDLSRAEVEARPGATVAHHVAYERVQGVDRVSTPDAHFFFDGDRLRVVYVSDASFGDVPAAPLLAELGRGEVMRSRSGKHSTMHVWPDRGLAASVDEDEERLEFVEVFPPMSLEEYLGGIYEEPAPHLM
jgi:hypothetical protein